MNREQAILQMNEYGRANVPFIFIIDFKMMSPLIFQPDEINPEEILFDINGNTNCKNESKLTKEIVFKKYPITFNQYRNAFDKVIQNINSGNSYLLNLTFPTKIETNLTLKEIFFHSTAKYKLFYKNEFIVFSPEIFVQIKDSIISSYPMKGTIDASIECAEEKILSDKKELAEHRTIIDLIRNDLSIVTKKVRVEKFRYVEKIKTNEKDLFQVSSKITGELSSDYRKRIGEIVFSLLPAGSISGAPKKKTVEIIEEVEGYNRGYYTGIFGCFDGNNLDSGVMIRFIENQNGITIFKSGGGITAFSNAESEYQELIDKVYVPIVRNN
ncbi:MAG: aminodeoxychorismate synthase component I [Ignavibacteriales bacterium]|nr:aminodeoxychorismate synthase component I [Ignavibacteriales bacterium]